MATPTRRLTLHASALTDDEYTVYTRSLRDLAEIEEGNGAGGQGADGDDEYYERISLGVREVRAWLRGRYAGVLGVGGMDTILKFFSPTLAPGDTLTGGQFFAALRLVTHVVNGAELDRGLAFVQARPSSQSQAQPPSSSSQPQQHKPTQAQAQAPSPPAPRTQPPQHPQHGSASSSYAPYAHSNSHSHPPHQLQHQHQGQGQGYPQVHPQAHPQPHPGSSTSSTSPPTHGSSTNPFIQRDRDGGGRTSPSKGPPLPPRKSTANFNFNSNTSANMNANPSTNPGGGVFLPLPPPRHHQHQHQHHHSSSISNTYAGGGGGALSERPVPPPKPSSNPYVGVGGSDPSTGGLTSGTSGGQSALGGIGGGGGSGTSGAGGTGSGIGSTDLIKTSLQAAQAAHASKRAEEVREKERVMRVLKSSSHGYSVGAVGSNHAQGASGSVYGSAFGSTAGSSSTTVTMGAGGRTGGGIGEKVPPPPPQHTKPLRSVSPTKVRPRPVPPSSSSKPLPSSSPSHSKPVPSASSSKPTQGQGQPSFAVLSSSKQPRAPGPGGAALSRAPPAPPSVDTLSSYSNSSSSGDGGGRPYSYSNPPSTSGVSPFGGGGRYAPAPPVPPFGAQHAHAQGQGGVGGREDGRRPDLPHRRPSSVSMSVSSLEQVALARAPSGSGRSPTARVTPNAVGGGYGGMGTSRSQPHSRSTSITRPRFGSGVEDGGGSGVFTQSPYGSPSRVSMDLPAGPPPMHPDRRPRREDGPGSFDAVYGAGGGDPHGYDGRGGGDGYGYGYGGGRREGGGGRNRSGSESPGFVPDGRGEDVFRTPPPSSAPTTRVFRSRSLNQPSSPLIPGSPFSPSPSPISPSFSPFGPSSPSAHHPSHHPSAHHGSNAAPEVPPRRKKRPESMQIGMLRRVSGGTGAGGTSPFDDDAPTVDTDSQESLAYSYSPTRATYGSSSTYLAPPPPLPPPRRKVTQTVNNQSVGASGAGEGGGGGGGGGSGAGLVRHSSLSSAGSGRGVHRRTSLSASGASVFGVPPSSSNAGGPLSPVTDSSPKSPHSATGGGVGASSSSPLNMKSMLGAIERTGDKISGKLGELRPGLEKARFKAEAGLNARRGWIPPPSGPGAGRVHVSSRAVREEREGLMRGSGGEGEGDLDVGLDTDGDGGSASDGERGREGRGRRGRERDEMKWPVGPGEGWVAL